MNSMEPFFFWKIESFMEFHGTPEPVKIEWCLEDEQNIPWNSRKQ